MSKAPLNSQVPPASNDTESDSDPERSSDRSAPLPPLAPKPKPKRRRSGGLAKLAQLAQAPQLLETEAPPLLGEPQGPQAPQAEQAPPAEHAYSFGRLMRITVEPNPAESPVIFFRNAGPGFCYIGCKVPLAHVAPVHKTRPKKPTGRADPDEPETPPAKRLKTQPCPLITESAEPAEPACETQPTPSTQSAEPTQFVRVVVLTKHDEKECRSEARRLDQTERSQLLAKVGTLLKLLDALSKAPIAIVASAEALQTIGRACVPLRSGANASFQHFEVPLGLANHAHPADQAGSDSVDIDATAKFITGKVRGSCCLNPTCDPNLRVRLAFAYDGAYDTSATQRIVMPECVYVGGNYVYPYPMLNYKYLKADPDAVESTLADMQRSPAYTNYVPPCGTAWELADQKKAWPGAWTGLELPGDVHSSAPASPASSPLPSVCQVGQVSQAPTAPGETVVWLDSDSES